MKKLKKLSLHGPIFQLWLICSSDWTIGFHTRSQSHESDWPVLAAKPAVFRQAGWRDTSTRRSDTSVSRRRWTGSACERCPSSCEPDHGNAKDIVTLKKKTQTINRDRWLASRTILRRKHCKKKLNIKHQPLFICKYMFTVSLQMQA